eukprot:ANDGO_06974.mRNA.1 hypothetical protein
MVVDYEGVFRGRCSNCARCSEYRLVAGATQLCTCGHGPRVHRIGDADETRPAPGMTPTTAASSSSSSSSSSSVASTSGSASRLDAEANLVYGSVLQTVGIRPRQKGNYILSAKAGSLANVVRFMLTLSFLFLVGSIIIYAIFGDCQHRKSQSHCIAYLSPMIMFTVICTVTFFLALKMSAKIDHNEIVFSDFDRIVVVVRRKFLFSSLRKTEQFEIPYYDVSGFCLDRDPTIRVNGQPFGHIFLEAPLPVGKVRILSALYSNAISVHSDLHRFLEARKPESADLVL